MTILGFIIFLCVAAGCAWLAESLVPNVVPGGFLVSALLGIIGGWLGTMLFGHFGPEVGGVTLVPTIFGSMLFVFLLTLLSRSSRRSVLR